MPLFEFELAPVDAITPWSPDPSLSWFALSLGRFWIDLGDEELFRYTPEMLAHWGVGDPHPDYQIAAFARDVLSCESSALAPLPAAIEALARDWRALSDFKRRSWELASIDRDTEDLAFAAWRWLGERSPCISYLQPTLRFSFVRLGETVRLAFDNRNCSVDGIQVWSTREGSVDFELSRFIDELDSFRERLFQRMSERLDDLEAGRVRAQVDVDIASLRREHAAFRAELAKPMSPHQPDFDWATTLNALGTLAERCGITLGR